MIRLINPASYASSFDHAKKHRKTQLIAVARRFWLEFFSIFLFATALAELRFSLPGSSLHYFFILQFRFMKFIHTLKNLVSI